MNHSKAVSFLTNTLCVSGVEEKLENNKYQLLCEIVKEFHENIPFQNYTFLNRITTAKANPGTKVNPTVEEIISDVTSGRGGLCYVMNVFMKLLLETLSYSVHHVVSSVKKNPDNHFITIATDVCSPGDRYLVDVATGIPTFKPIPLDFHDESPIYDDSFIMYKFKKIDEKHFVRQRKFRAPDSEWELFCSWDTTPKTLEEMEDAVAAIYSDPTLTPFHTSLRTLRFPNGKAVCIRDMTLLVEDDNHVLQPKELNKAEFLAAVKEYFPMLEETAIKALKNWTSSR